MSVLQINVKYYWYKENYKTTYGRYGYNRLGCAEQIIPKIKKNIVKKNRIEKK
jgi:hypothetical protein